MMLRKAVFLAACAFAILFLAAKADTALAASAANGEKIYQQNCAVCHGDKGQGRGGPMGWFTGGGGETSGLIGNQLSNQNFLAMASNDFIKATIENGRPGRPMPAWKGKIKDSEIQDIIAFLRTWQTVPNIPISDAHVWGNPEDGNAVFKGVCASCHGENGEGTDFGPALNNQAFLEAASDDFIRQTVTQGRPGTVMKPFLRGNDQAVAELEPYQINDVVAFIRTWDKKAREKLEPWLLEAK